MDIEAIKSFFNSLIKAPELQPTPAGVTWCNVGSRRVAQFFGCHDFDSIELAEDEIHQIMRESDKWVSVNGATAVELAMAGALCFAVMTAEQLKEAHAHLAAVYPAPMQVSPSLCRAVPLLANVGAKNGIFKESEVFPVSQGEAAYYHWNS